MKCMFLYWFQNVYGYEYEFGLIEIFLCAHIFIILYYG